MKLSFALLNKQKLRIAAILVHYFKRLRNQISKIALHVIKLVNVKEKQIFSGIHAIKTISTISLTSLYLLIDTSFMK